MNRKAKGIAMGPVEKLELTPFSSPKERFMAESNNIQLHQDLVDDASFNRGADAAMLQFVDDLGRRSVDPNAAMSVGFQLRGAVEFLAAFKTLAETPKVTQRRVDTDNLIQPNDPRRP